VVLHGYADAKEDMMHWALCLAQTGYRVVLVDLRGHGRSTGKWIGYGTFETRDLEQLMDDLQKKGLTTGPVGLLGISYGASVGLQLAGHDRRIGAVVAIEPFSDPRRSVVEFAHAVVPSLVEGWTDRDFATAEDRACRLANFSWADANVLKSVQQGTAPILYVYATHDRWISPENTRVLAANTHSPHAVMTVTFSGENGLEDHVLLSWTLDPVSPEVVKWLDECLLKPGPGLQERLTKLGFVP
jgi:pimeloyl-ACP methyl ester carboxylesterase